MFTENMSNKNLWIETNKHLKVIVPIGINIFDAMLMPMGTTKVINILQKQSHENVSEVSCNLIT